MKWLLVSCSLVLASCSQFGGSYCDIVQPMYFEDDGTVSWLMQNDRTLLVDIIVHNETTDRLCGEIAQQ